jgi:hypothetical protein
MRFAFCAFLLLAAWGCGDSGQQSMMDRPGMTGPAVGAGPQSSSAALLSIAPPGGSTAVATSAPIALRFGAPMAPAMEQYVDLHRGGIDGPLVPMSCGFSPDRTTLTCTPNGPLEPRTTYVFHVGGGMMTAAGHPIDYGAYGRWLTGGTMGPGHGGQGWGMMGPGWRHSNGSYGMEFPFTTE